MSSGTMPTCASAPFDEDGDIILRTSDGVDFHVYRIILVLATPWFRSMFSLQQPVSASSNLAPNVPVIDVPEDAETWDCLLRYCYPIPDPVIDGLELLEKTLEAALKYELLEATSICRSQIPMYISAQPLRTYVMCWRLHLEHEAAQAAKGWKEFLGHLGRPATPPPFRATRTGLCWTPEMENLPSEVYRRLIQFVDGNEIPRFCGFASGSESREMEKKWSPEYVSLTYPFNLADTDIIMRSADGVNFPTHRLIVTLNTHPGASETSSLLDAKPLVDPPESEHPVLQTDFDSRILGSLLQLIYPPRPGEDISEWPVERIIANLSAGIMTAAQRCGLHHVQRQYESQWERCLKVDAGQLFRVAVRAGLPSRARAAADYLAATKTMAETLHLDSADLTAGEFHRLLRYIYHQQETVAVVVCRFAKNAETEKNRMRWLELIRSHGRQAAITAALVASESKTELGSRGDGCVQYDPDPQKIAKKVRDLEGRITEALEDESVEL